MKFIKNEKVIDIMQNTLNFVDSRLINHGKRVAYLVFKILESQNKYSAKEMRDICMLALLHDIGAYKTEEISKMTQFETVDVWDHSICGYLFLKYFSPLKDLAPIVLFHHANCQEAKFLAQPYRELSQIILLCDRADVYLLAGNDAEGFHDYIEKYRDVQFPSDVIDVFFKLDMNLNHIDENINHDQEFLRILYGTPLAREEAEDYIKMTIFAIDSRSSQTVIHSIATVCISSILAKLSGLDEDDTEEITTAAILHDIGKTGVPVSILESAKRLDETEMSIMKSHVDMTEQIISGSVIEKIKQIALKHHEKLDGTGYPKGVTSSDISLKERILIVSDILSALCQARSYKEAWPKEKIIGIMDDMSARGFIDAGLANLAIEHFDDIMDKLNQKSQPVLETYQKIQDEYARLKSKITESDFENLKLDES